jgi:hypothetical protein
MKAYNETWVENLYLSTKLKECLKNILITKTEFEVAVKEFSNGFYQPNWFITIGLFFFVSIAIMFGTGLFFFIAGVFDNEKGAGVLLVLASGILFFILEILIKSRNLFRSGIDNAMLYFAAGFLAVGNIFLLTNNYSPDYVKPLIIFVVLFPCVVRYADPLVVGATFFSLLAFVFLSLNTFSVGKALLPFVIMALSLVIYFISKKKTNDLYYYDSHQIVETLALGTFYLAGNYYVVRELNANMNYDLVSKEIPFATLFWIFTFTIPFLLILYGIKTKERKSIIIGLLAFGFSIFTFRHYHSIMPLELALTIGGLFLILISVFCIKFFKIPKFNLSSETEDLDKLQKLETILVSQAFDSKPVADDSTKFGGGQFGGGGAGGNY